MVMIYISCANEDGAYRDHLKKWLKPKGFVTRDRSDIRTGYNRNKEIADNLEKSQIFVLLYSSDYLASNDCLIEEKAAWLRKQQLQEKCVVFPVYIRPCAIEESRFGNFPILPGNKDDDGDYIPVGSPSNDKIWKKIVKSIEDAVISLQSNKAQTIITEE